MFLTINPNSAIDRILFIDQFVPGGVMRPEKVVDSIGGKGFDIAVALRGLGQDVMALGFRAGQGGVLLERMLDEYRIRHEMVPVRGETRIAHVIAENRTQRHSHINTRGYDLNDKDIIAFIKILKKHLKGACWMAAAGSLPHGAPENLFARFVKIARDEGVKSLIDSSDGPQEHALKARSDILKMNEEELSETFEVSATNHGELARKCKEFAQQEELPNFVITCGKKGILAVTQGRVYRTSCPVLSVVNAAGAGDAVSAALMWRLAKGNEWTEALRWAAAAGAAAVLTERTAELRLSDVEQILPEVTVQPIL
jgi:1-phosphofructokinase family hexose kinase